jgi:hypothetical protein
LDLNGDRLSNYAVWHLPRDGSQYQVLLDVRMDTEEATIIATSFRDWGPTGTLPPEDVPRCGFRDELCPADSSRKSAPPSTQMYLPPSRGIFCHDFETYVSNHCS